jgi:hypothetical protein
MRPAPLDIQSITSLAHDPFKAILPISAVIPVQINEATRHI